VEAGEVTDAVSVSERVPVLLTLLLLTGEPICADERAGG
jgi:hypothetical protein